ncbi:family 20 glycosylhydrolase [Microbacterium marmarense]|uniref:beta-N-acetylhexosaminidase n=1 Tax=Microbacterium marmarense TaxID=3122051 RepID=A0ABU8LV92_9MICO
MPIPSVVPAPSTIEIAEGDPPFTFSGSTVLTGDPDATALAATLLARRTGVAMPVALRHRQAPDGFAPNPVHIDFSLTPGLPAESYRLRVRDNGIEATASDEAGLFYSIHTLSQLVQGRDGEFSIPSVLIEDSPRFAYRGVMLDVARHFHSVETVKAYIDRAVSLKFNVLHLHLTDDQGWRIELHSRPELTAMASGTSVGGHPGGFFTKSDYREIVDYAASRHMTVVPEVDVPGHTHAVGLAYPELVEEPVLSEHIHEVVHEYGGSLPQSGTPYDGLAVGFSSLKIHDEKTYDFLADVFGELAGMTPGPYLHLGGDEALGTEPADFAEFIRRASELIADLDKIPVAWHEAGAAAGLHDSTVGQYWGFVTPIDGMDDKARAFARNGAQLILSPADAIYLDMKPTADASLGLTWANGPTSVERAYSWEPATVIAGITDADILGVEAPLWTETVRDLDAIDALAFPRIAAAAEAAWSPPTGHSKLRTWDSFRARVGRLGPLWTSQGIRFSASEEIDWSQE